MLFRPFFNSPSGIFKCLFLSNLSTAHLVIKIEPLITILEIFCTTCVYSRVGQPQPYVFGPLYPEQDPFINVFFKDLEIDINSKI